MAFVVPSSISGDSDNIIDIYPKEQKYNTGGQAKGTQGRQTSNGVGNVARKVAGNPRVQELAGHLGNAAIDRLNNKFKGGKPNGRNKQTRLHGSRNGSDNGSGDSNNGGNGNSGNSNRGGGGGSGNSGRGFQKTGGVSRVLWSSGIDAGIVVNSRLHSQLNSPLYLSSGWFFRVSDTRLETIENQVNVQLEGIFFPLYEQIISNKINRYAGQFIDKEDFKRWFNAMNTAVQIYYCIDDILAYSSNNTQDNVNFGMESLRNKLTAEVMVEFNLLKEVLENSIYPPELLEYIRFMCQTYRQSDAPHAALIKVNIGGMFDQNWTNGISTNMLSMIKQARESVVSESKMTSFLNRAFESWLINDLPPSANEAHYDINFMTFWHNQNCCYKEAHDSVDFKYTHFLTSQDAFMDYQILERDKEVDGAIFATASSFIEVGGITKESYWGIWQPLATTLGKDIPAGDQRETFNLKVINNIGEVESIKNNVTMGRSGVHWVVLYTGSVGAYVGARKQFGVHGFVDLQVVNPRMQNEAFNNTMRLFLDPPSL